MPIISSFLVWEETPSLVQRKKQCYVCDRYFRTKRELIAHRKLYHKEVIVFEIFKEDKKTFAFVNSWQIANFDDLFFSENDNDLPSDTKMQTKGGPKVKRLGKHKVSKLQLSSRSRQT